MTDEELEQLLREAAENPQPSRQCDVHRSACDTRICRHAYDLPAVEEYDPWWDRLVAEVGEEEALRRVKEGAENWPRPTPEQVAEIRQRHKTFAEMRAEIEADPVRLARILQLEHIYGGSFDDEGVCIIAEEHGLWPPQD